MRYLVANLIETSETSAGVSWALIGVVLVLSLLNSLFNASGKRMVMTMEMRLKTLISAMIYGKVSGLQPILLKISYFLSFNRSISARKDYQIYITWIFILFILRYCALFISRFFHRRINVVTT